MENQSMQCFCNCIDSYFYQALDRLIDRLINRLIDRLIDRRMQERPVVLIEQVME